MRVDRTSQFKKSFKKADRKIQVATIKRLVLFAHATHHPLLNTHSLTGKWRGYYSINVTGDWRAIFRYSTDETVLFVELGTHSQLFGK